jgi:maltose alpha-D-glucosyltransferase / alpha-amylase
MAAPGIARETFRELRHELPPQLPEYLKAQRWFGGKARPIRGTEIVDVIPVQSGSCDAFVLLVQVNYESGPSETYVLPVISAPDSVTPSPANSPTLNLRGRKRGGPGILQNALADIQFLSVLLDAIARGSLFRGLMGEIRASRTSAFEKLCPGSCRSLTPRPVKTEQSNSSIIYGESLILKFFRRAEEGINPDLEIGEFLTKHAHFQNIPPVAGSVEYRTNDGRQFTLGMLQGFVRNRGDAWGYTMKSLAPFYTSVSKRSKSPEPVTSLLLSNQQELPAIAVELFGSYLDRARLLGQRTAEMHRALASDSSNPAFAPEPYTVFSQRSAERRARALTESSLTLLNGKLGGLSEDVGGFAQQVLSSERMILHELHSALTGPAESCRTRIHGDYHLGQVLYTGSDFVIIDFEGEPARPMEDRRKKQSPLQDVAGMLRSFHYAAHAGLRSLKSECPDRPAADGNLLVAWAECWSSCVGRQFLRQYLETSNGACYLPDDPRELHDLLRLHLLEKAIYELAYELNNRPDWVEIPLIGITKLLMS